MNKFNYKAAYEVTRDANHIYYVNGCALPGTTGILDIIGGKDKQGALIGWAKKLVLKNVEEHLTPLIGTKADITEQFIKTIRKSAWKQDKKKLDEAADLGTRVHDAIDAFIETGYDPEMDDDVKAGYANFKGWLQTTGIEIIKGDTLVAHPGVEACKDFAYGGALDALGIHNGGMVLLDWKTSNAMRDTYPLQAAAYVKAAEATYPKLKITGAYVVRFGKENAGDMETKEVNIESAWQAFISAVNLNKSMKLNHWK
jgi:hypothetical protein